ncbi:MAG TPA: NAD(P)-binding domain-containing protein, partial [Burkholderiales bacterium]|nr:NAD(P)-binding domain-containing protein [Burkholderiales bacterium]
MTNTLGKIGFAGIGAMGTPMSTNLIKAGHKLALFDIDPRKATAVAATNEVEIASSLADLGSKSNTVITMLPDGKLVRKALLGENDSGKHCICETLKPGSLIIDMSSSSPMGTREL